MLTEWNICNRSSRFRTKIGSSEVIYGPAQYITTQSYPNEFVSVALNRKKIYKLLKIIDFLSSTFKIIFLYQIFYKIFFQVIEFLLTYMIRLWVRKIIILIILIILTYLYRVEIYNNLNCSHKPHKYQTLFLVLFRINFKCEYKRMTLNLTYFSSK